MANNLQGSTTNSSSVFREIWARRMQMQNLKASNYPAIVSMEADDAIEFGWAYHKPYRSLLTVNTYTPGSNVSLQTLTNTDEVLLVNQLFEASFYVDDFDQLRSNFNFIDEYASDAGTKLGDYIDGQVNGEYANASSKIDDGTLGGTAGNGLTLTTSNVQNVFAAAKARLGRYNAAVNVNVKAGVEKLFCVASPDFIQVLVLYLAGKNSNLGDKSGLNGHIGSYYGFDIYESNELTWTATLALSVTPTANDTVTLKQITEDGVTQTITFTFVSTIGSTAGNVLFTSATDANTNLAALINAPGTTTANGVALSTANQSLLSGVVATANTNVSTTIVGKGASFFVASSSFTSASNAWTAAKEIQHVLFGVKGAINIAIKRKPKVEIKDDPLKFGKNILNGILYGIKTFQTDKVKLVDAQVRTDAYTL
jgi:hypothetical protein